VTEKEKMYGDVFHQTQVHQHAYECVQPLQGLITFTDPELDEDGKYTNYHRNNFSTEKVDKSKAPEPQSWYSVIYAMLAVKLILGFFMLGYMDTQTAYNDIYMTNFQFASSTTTYSVEGAGITKPLYCLVIALSLVVFSVVIGLVSSQKYLLDGKVSWLIFIVLLALQAYAFVLHIVMLAQQSADLNISCLTIWSMLFLHLLAFIISIIALILLMCQPKSSQLQTIKEVEAKNEIQLQKYNMEKEAHDQYYKDQKFRELKFESESILTHEDIFRETTGNFWLSVVEDLNTIVCYAFVVRACDAQSSIHDDSTIFFDVMCIVFLGFLQHVANILMIFHAHIDKHSQLETKRATSNDKKKKIENQTDDLMTFIARTRLLLFLMIGCTVVFFFLRVAPTYEEYAIAIPYEVIRVLALITMVSLNTLHSFWFEVQNAYARRKPWDTSPTWKLGALSFIALVFSLMLIYNVSQDVDGTVRANLHKQKSLTVAVIKNATTTPPMTTTPPPPRS